uniref:NADH-ubiquinone oxidoreductase chain 6 n=1 Tax=Strongylium suspicax TaxID=1205598 RepID=A0A0S2MPV0_9CUCU|nr:NADH deshydrogenase subunit 6 [Strongylium suspicax]
MLTILSINLTMTALFPMMKHPLSMGMILLIQTTLISMITSSLNQNSWFSYILFLIMIGGMLILFMYMTSVASNEKFKMNNKLAAVMLMIPAIITMASEKINTSFTNSETQNMYSMPEPNMFMNKYINFPLSMILIFMMIYLLLALIATVKITKFKQGSIRQMN